MHMLISSAGGNVTNALTETALGHSRIADVDLHAARVETNEVRAASRRRQAVKQVAPPAVLSLAKRLVPQHRLIPRQWKSYPRTALEAVGDRDAWSAATQAIITSDVLVIHGDGAITGNGVIPRTILFLAYLAKKYYGKPVTLVNHTADLSHPDLREIAYHVYPLLDDVVFRDPISVEHCRDLCNGRYAADSAFLFRPVRRDLWTNLVARPTYFDVWPDVAAFDPSEPYICVGGSSMVTTTADTARVTSGYRALIQMLREQYGGSVVLTAADVHDQAFLRPLAGELRLPLVGLHTPIQQVVDIIGNADAYIGGRWHPGIFALRGGTPIIPLSAKTAKMQALARMVGLAGTLPDALNLVTSVDAVGRKLMDCLAQGHALRDHLRAWAANESGSCAENVALLSRLHAKISVVDDGEGPAARST